LKVFKLCRKADAHQDDFILRADALETNQFQIESNCDESRRITSGFVRPCPAFLTGKGTGVSIGSFVYFCPSWVCFNNVIGVLFEGRHHNLQMKQKYVSYAYIWRGVTEFYWASGKMKNKLQCQDRALKTGLWKCMCTTSEANSGNHPSCQRYCRRHCQQPTVLEVGILQS